MASELFDLVNVAGYLFVTLSFNFLQFIGYYLGNQDMNKYLLNQNLIKVRIIYSSLESCAC